MCDLIDRNLYLANLRDLLHLRYFNIDIFSPLIGKTYRSSVVKLEAICRVEFYYKYLSGRPHPLIDSNSNHGQNFKALYPGDSSRETIVEFLESFPFFSSHTIFKGQNRVFKY